jgi:ubiquinone/menaquinone biosynthesis C-methylase UbiE
VQGPVKQQTLSYEQAKRFYDRLGAMQDTQGFYEQAALADLVAHLDLSRAQRLIEFGCGTGRFAEELFDRYLCSKASYVGVDVSGTMVKLAKSRTARFEGRAAIQQTSGLPQLNLPGAMFDRFISSYVLDLLSEEDIGMLLDEAYRVLVTGGRLGVVNLTTGSRGLSRLVSSGWEQLHRFWPMLVGGCRPITIVPRLERYRWTVLHRNVVKPFGIASEIVVAEKSYL